MASIAQINVIKTNTISIAANRLFFSPNCNGVKDKLKIIFNRKGKKTMNGIVFCKNISNTFPKETAINN